MSDTQPTPTIEVIRNMSDEEIADLNTKLVKQFMKFVAIKSVVYIGIAVTAHIVAKKLEQKI